MKLNRLMVGVLALLLVPSDTYAQKWIDNIQKALETVDKVLKPIGDKGQSNSEKKTAARTEVARIGDAEETNEGGTFRMTTNHPDFKVKVKRCEVSGKTCVIDMIFENVGSEDVTISAGRLWGAIAYDDEANQYLCTQDDATIQIALGKTSDWSWSSEITLMPEVPIKVRVQVEKVSLQATMFRRMKINIMSSAWSLDRDKPLTFYNLPISREGNE